MPQIGFARFRAPLSAIRLSRIVQSLQIDKAMPPQPAESRISGVVAPTSLRMQRWIRFSEISSISTAIASPRPSRPSPMKAQAEMPEKPMSPMSLRWISNVDHRPRRFRPQRLLGKLAGQIERRRIGADAAACVGANWLAEGSESATAVGHDPADIAPVISGVIVGGARMGDLPAVQRHILDRSQGDAVAVAALDDIVPDHDGPRAAEDLNAARGEPQAVHARELRIGGQQVPPPKRGVDADAAMFDQQILAAHHKRGSAAHGRIFRQHQAHLLQDDLAAAHDMALSAGDPDPRAAGAADQEILQHHALQRPLDERPYAPLRPRRGDLLGLAPIRSRPSSSRAVEPARCGNRGW